MFAPLLDADAVDNDDDDDVDDDDDDVDDDVDAVDDDDVDDDVDAVDDDDGMGSVATRCTFFTTFVTSLIVITGSIHSNKGSHRDRTCCDLSSNAMRAGAQLTRHTVLVAVDEMRSGALLLLPVAAAADDDDDDAEDDDDDDNDADAVGERVWKGDDVEGGEDDDEDVV